jgi:rhodanese-related sulfurtransferase
MYIAWRWWRRRVARAPDVLRISADELQALLAAGERPLVVDVRGRTTQQIDPRRVPDSIAISLDAIEASRDELPRDRKIVVYCGCPNEASAARAARLLLGRGYPWVRPLVGGLEAWSTVEHASVTDTPPEEVAAASEPALLGIKWTLKAFVFCSANLMYTAPLLANRRHEISQLRSRTVTKCLIVHNSPIDC